MTPTQSISTKSIVLILSLVILPFGGCASLEGKSKIIKQREALQTKIRNLKALEAAIASQTLQSGILSSKIRELYGEPDDIFSSGSTTGRFEIWSYEQMTAGPEMSFRPIRLYFNNEKLVSWNY